MANFLDTLLRDSAEGEHFCPTDEPTFLPAQAPRGVQLRARAATLRSVVELVIEASPSPPFAGINFLDALIWRVRPPVDPDRFTLGLGLATPIGEQGDPYPILF